MASFCAGMKKKPPLSRLQHDDQMVIVIIVITIIIIITTMTITSKTPVHFNLHYPLWNSLSRAQDIQDHQKYITWVVLSDEQMSNGCPQGWTPTTWKIWKHHFSNVCIFIYMIDICLPANPFATYRCHKMPPHVMLVPAGTELQQHFWR